MIGLRSLCRPALALLLLVGFACSDDGGGDTLPDVARDLGADSPVVPDGVPPSDTGGELERDVGADLEVDAGWPAGFVPVPQNVTTDLLCDIPPDYVDSGGDPVNPPCAFEADNTLSDRDRFDVPQTLKIVTWNVEWGKDAVAVKAALAAQAQLVDADVLILQEVPRYDNEGSPSGINLAREIAEQQQMNYVFAVEWDRRLNKDQGGEHGVATLSKYPIGNATQIRHTPCWNFYQEKSHFGGRTTLGVDLAVGDRRVRIYNSHLATRDYTGAGRAKQGEEILADAALPGQPASQLLGGDLNTFLCTPILSLCNDPNWAERVIKAILADGWTDLLPTFDSWTQLGIGFVHQRLDWLFGKQVSGQGFSVLQQIDAADHVPVVVTFSLP